MAKGPGRCTILIHLKFVYIIGLFLQIPMADLAKSVGQGKIKATVKSSKSHLGVQDGDSVEIIRMNEPNPKGKFLVRLTESQAGGHFLV